MNAPIGVIDSGVGGLTVAKEIMKLLPNEQIFYIGDNARCPYGPRSLQEVKKYTWQMAQALMKKKIKMLVIACNTATAAALNSLQKKLPIPVIGVIFPGARAAVKTSSSKDIAVLGTLGTVQSGAYEKAIKSLVSSAHVVQLACPRFVPLVESDEYEGGFARRMVQETLSQLEGETFDTAILGCTHYPLLQGFIEEVLGDGVQVLSSAKETAKDVERHLRFKKQFAGRTKLPVHHFYTSGSIPIFKTIIEKWLDIEEPVIHSIRFPKT
ncbi:glutamate racemase [Planococcus shenhongbingii]|uniref:glutamate racemase n=1 Tax=Planococcus shenhongbingii TaxID=3058398 RepID=UPI00262A413E|nr:glutamate racemase [Planococcus sp. N016]WKA59948.1 glutamate racemase [Planococcus sp. N016]